MQESIIRLNENIHRHTGVLESTDFKHAANQHIIPITVDELVDAATEFPIAFVKNTSTGKFTLATIMGLKPDNNLYFGQSDTKANYIPRVVRLFPFALTSKQGANEWEVCLQQNSELLVENAGKRLFAESGDRSEYLQQKINLLTHHAEQQQVTDIFIDMLLEKQLLHAQTVKVALGNDDSVSFDGVYSVNIEVLDKLPDRDFLEMRINGALQIIYAHLHSLKQLNRLAHLTRQQLDT